MFEIVRLSRDPETTLRRFRRLLLGWLFLAFGAFMAVLFSVGIVYELRTGTVFGLCICIMLIAFGGLAMRDGIAQLTGLRLQLTPDDDT